jgi:hypothetical protein
VDVSFVEENIMLETALPQEKGTHRKARVKMVEKTAEKMVEKLQGFATLATSPATFHETAQTIQARVRDIGKVEKAVERT